MTDITVGINGNINTLDLSGELNVNCAQELRNALVQALENADQIVLSINSVTEVDLSCLQLLCSAHKTASELNISIIMNTSLPDAFKDAARKTGYSGNFNCTAGTAGSCLWKGI